MASRRRYSSKQVVDILFALPSDEEVSEDEDDEVVTQRQTLFSCFLVSTSAYGHPSSVAAAVMFTSYP